MVVTVDYLFIFTLVTLSSCKLVRVDLTHNFEENATAYWQMSDSFRFTSKTRSSSPFYESNSFCASEHGGTHIDAPRHFAEGKQGTHEIPLERLIAKPYFVDISNEVTSNSDYELDVAKLTEVEQNQGQIPDGSILLIYTGFSLKWNNLTSYFGGNPKNSSTYHFPGISPTAAQWLVDNRQIASIGLDTPSIDFGQSKNFESHKILYNQNIPGFENINLSPLKPIIDKKDLLVIALPMKIKDGSGGPMRIVATYDDTDSGTSSAVIITPFASVLILMVFCIVL